MSENGFNKISSTEALGINFGSSDVVALIKDEEKVLREALVQKKYDSEALKQYIKCISSDLFDLFYGQPENQNKSWYEEALQECIKERLKELVALKRNIVETLGQDPFGNLMIDPTLGKVDQRVIKDTVNFYLNSVKYCFWLGSPENCQATLIELNKEIIKRNFLTITVSLKDIIKAHPDNIVGTFGNELRQKLVMLVDQKSKNNIDDYKNFSLYEILRKGYGWPKGDFDGLWNGEPIRVCIVISDLEEVFDLPDLDIKKFLEMYGTLIGAYAYVDSSVQGYSEIFPTSISGDGPKNTLFIGCGDLSTGGNIFSMQRKQPYLMKNVIGL